MRLPLRNLLCATDMSDVGDGAVAMAYTLATRGATVHLLHVVVPTAALSALGPYPMTPILETPEDVQAREREARQHLDGLVPPDAAARGVRTQIHVLHEIGPASSIEREARRLEADLIVLGTHGRGGLVRAVLGSVANAVLRHAPVPVVLFHRPAERADLAARDPAAPRTEGEPRAGEISAA